MSEVDSIPASVGLWARRRDVLWRTVLDAVLILRAEGDDAPLVVSGSAAALWQALDSSIGMAELAMTLSSWYETPVETIAADLGVALTNLEAAGVVEHAS
jgi:hypothetical protein